MWIGKVIDLADYYAYSPLKYDGIRAEPLGKGPRAFYHYAPGRLIRIHFNPPSRLQLTKQKLFSQIAQLLFPHNFLNYELHQKIQDVPEIESVLKKAYPYAPVEIFESMVINSAYLDLARNLLNPKPLFFLSTQSTGIPGNVLGQVDSILRFYGISTFWSPIESIYDNGFHTPRLVFLKCNQFSLDTFLQNSHLSIAEPERGQLMRLSSRNISMRSFYEHLKEFKNDEPDAFEDYFGDREFRKKLQDELKIAI